MASDALLAREDDVVEVRLDAEHSVLFSPRTEAGVLVVNEAASGVLKGFREPSTVGAALARWDGSQADHERVVAKLVNLGMVAVDGVSRVAAPASPGTLVVWLHVTNECNLRCPGCYVETSREAMGEAVGLAAVEQVIESAVVHGYRTVKLKYAGGEASLNHALVRRLHDHARRHAARHGVGLEATLLSNGVALPLKFVEFLRRRGIRVMISLDGVGELHDAHRPFRNGRGSFTRVDAVIGALLGEGLAPHLSMTISGRTVRGVPDVVRYALARGLTFSLNLFRDNDCAAGVEDLRYIEGEVVEGMLAAFDVIEEQLPPWSVLGSVLDRAQLLQPRERSCGVGRDYVVVDQRGRVASCHMQLEQTLGDVVGSDPVELVRQDTAKVMNPSVRDKEGCRTCAWRDWCGGGCPVATFRATGRFDVPSPNCGIYRALFPRALRLEGLRLLKYRSLA